jgi:hypothetical protein
MCKKDLQHKSELIIASCQTSPSPPQFICYMFASGVSPWALSLWPLSTSSQHPDASKKGKFLNHFSLCQNKYNSF